MLYTHANKGLNSRESCIEIVLFDAQLQYSTSTTLLLTTPTRLCDDFFEEHLEFIVKLLTVNC